jgi:outer membrane receptor protein involved in Fe transport
LPDGEVDHGAGNFDLGVLPNFKFNAGIGWTKFHGFGAGINLRFLNSLLECGALSSPVAIGASNGACYQLAANSAQLGVLSSQLIHTIPAYAQTDVYLSYELQWLIGKTTVQAGINNLFDVAPPAMYNAFTPNADPSAYDFIGRFFYLKLVQKI